METGCSTAATNDDSIKNSSNNINYSNNTTINTTSDNRYDSNNTTGCTPAPRYAMKIYTPPPINVCSV